MPCLWRPIPRGFLPTEKVGLTHVAKDTSSLVGTPLEKNEHHGLLKMQTRRQRVSALYGRRVLHLEERPIAIAVNHIWMHIAFTADRRGISQVFGNAFDGLGDISLGLGFGFAGAEFPEVTRGQHRGGPGADIFGGKILTINLP